MAPLRRHSKKYASNYVGTYVPLMGIENLGLIHRIAPGESQGSLFGSRRLMHVTESWAALPCTEQKQHLSRGIVRCATQSLLFPYPLSSLFIFIAAITYAEGAMVEENIASLLHDELA